MKKVATATVGTVFAFLLLLHPCPAAEPSVQVFTDGNVSDAGASATEPALPRRLQFSASVHSGYNNNVSALTHGEGSWFNSVNASLTYQREGERTQVRAFVSSTISYYPSRPNGRSSDESADLDLFVSHRISLRLKVTGEVSATYRTEPEIESDLGGTTRSRDRFVNTEKIAATYEWSKRLTSVHSLGLNYIDFADEITSATADRVAYRSDHELRYSWSPSTTLLGEYKVAFIDYDQAPRDSVKHTLLAGIDMSYSERTKIGFRAGATVRSFEDGGDRTDPYVDASADYLLGPSSTLSWTARYSNEEPDTINARSRISARTGLRIRQQLRPRLTATAALYYRHDDYDSSSLGMGPDNGFSEDSYHLSLGLAYTIYRHFSVSVEYDRTEVTSDSSLGSYARNRYSAGLNFTY